MIDQQTRRRITKQGLTALDESKACPGYVLYNSMSIGRTIYLIDWHGTVVHQWTVAHPPLYGYLLPNGNLFYIGKLREDRALFPEWKRFNCGIMQEVNWAGQVIWEHRDPNQHHDARRTLTGGALYPAIQRLPTTIAAAIQGGIPGSELDCMWTDTLIEVDAAGHVIWTWSSAEHLDVASHPLPSNLSRRDWTHTNAVVPLANDSVLVSFRSLSAICLIDKASKQIVWEVGPGLVSTAHDPQVLPNGNLLLFDNGLVRDSFTYPYSRVIEVEPLTRQIVWSYEDTPEYNFFSPYTSSVQRLRNGNTLITEGAFGRIFQVTAEKEVVWEYINPHFGERPRGGVANHIFKATHYLPHEIPGL